MSEIFHLFPSLPTEIRHQIWDDAISLFPRVIEASLVPYSHIVGGAWILRSTAIPTLLSVNSESRSIAKRSYSQIFQTDPWMPWTEQKSYYHLLINYEIDTSFINMRNARMYDSSVLNILTQIFGHDAAMELKQNLKSLAGTWEFWSKLLRSHEIPFERGGEGPDHLEELILVCNQGKTWEGNSRLSSLRDLAWTTLHGLRIEQILRQVEWVTIGQEDSKPIPEVLGEFRNWLLTARGLSIITWIPEKAKVSKCVVREIW